MLNHLAIIMDGNGRWAKARSLPRLAGHKKGAETARKIISECSRLKVAHLTLYTFSAENWNRPASEVSDLMNLLRFYLNNEISNLHKNGVRIRFIGDRERLSDDIIKQAEKAEELTKDNKELNLNIALSYGSRQEIAAAARRVADDVAGGKINSNDVNENIFSSYLYTHEIPEPDLLIRTGGEQRLSNFLLWQLAYTELYFTDTLWPDFSEKNLEEAIEEFYRRERRFGGTEAKKVSAL